MSSHDSSAHQSSGGKPSSKPPLHAPPQEVMKYLQGMSYPTHKKELLAAAKQNNAPPDVVRALEIMYSEIFQTAHDVEENLKSSEARDR